MTGKRKTRAVLPWPPDADPPEPEPTLWEPCSHCRGTGRELAVWWEEGEPRPPACRDCGGSGVKPT